MVCMGMDKKMVSIGVYVLFYATPAQEPLVLRHYGKNTIKRALLREMTSEETTMGEGKGARPVIVT